MNGKHRIMKEGWNAYLDNYPSGANPYDRETAAYTYWLEGWFTAKEGIEDVDFEEE